MPCLMNEDAAVEITAFAAGAGPPEKSIATLLIDDFTAGDADISQKLQKKFNANRHQETKAPWHCAGRLKDQQAISPYPVYSPRAKVPLHAGNQTRADKQILLKLPIRSPFGQQQHDVCSPPEPTVFVPVVHLQQHLAFFGREPNTAVHGLVSGGRCLDSPTTLEPSHPFRQDLPPLLLLRSGSV